MPRDALLHSWIKEHCPNCERFEPASADASFRRFFRLYLKDKSTAILMDIPPEKEDAEAFLKVAEILQKGAIPSPLILKTDIPNGFVLVSDLGRIIYLEALKAEPSAAKLLMMAAVDVLIRFQKISKAGVLPPYNFSLLMNEMRLFKEWFIEKHLNFTLNETQEQELESVFQFLANRALNQPKVFVHRDFMPRNLMLPEKGESLTPYLIDFQDAVYGPITYDVVSLFRDAFISWEEETELDWVIRYWEKARAEKLPVREDFSVFWQDYEWMGLQRHLKVLGIFSRLKYRDQKPHYATDLPRFMRYAKKVSRRYQELAPLYRLLQVLEPETTQEGLTF